MKILIATKNAHKVDEITAALSGLPVELYSGADLRSEPVFVESAPDFAGNARKKAMAFLKEARSCKSLEGSFVLADDSGLEVYALGGRPGVQSARYAGKDGDHAANNAKLLRELEGVPDERRGARFVCTILLLAPDGREWLVTGFCEGRIIGERRGQMGFGFDPLFFVPEFGKTMAELTMDEKNLVSHRGRAVAKLRDILVEFLGKT